MEQDLDIANDPIRLSRMKFLSLCYLPALPLSPQAADAPSKPQHTAFSIVGDEFYINGHPTYAGRTWHRHKVQGLLLNARLVQV